MQGGLKDAPLRPAFFSHGLRTGGPANDFCVDTLVFRNGRNVATYLAGTKTDNEVVEMMIGREYSHVFPPKPQRDQPPAPVLAIDKLSWGER